MASPLVAQLNVKRNVWLVIKDVDECESSPCLNGAACIDLDNGYRCQCTDGWQGNTCNQGNEITAHCILAANGVHCDDDVGPALK